MKTIYQILVDILINPIISNNSNIDSTQLDEIFWNEFALDFVDYKQNAEPVYFKLYKLSLTNPENVFEQLDRVHDLFIRHLAELYLTGYQDDVVTKLINSNNLKFSTEVSFLKTLKNVIRKSGRSSLKKKMPFMIKNLETNIDDQLIKKVALSQSRAALKEKFNKWDLEIKEDKFAEKVIVKYQLSGDKIVSVETSSDKNNSNLGTWISWGKYAMAACILLGISFTVKLILDSDSQLPNNVSVAKNKPIINQIDNLEPELVFPDADESTIFRTFLNDSQGFINSDKKQKIIIINYSTRLRALNSSLQSSNKKVNFIKINNEIDSLMRQSNTYLFKNNVLKIRGINNANDLKLINLSNQAAYVRIGKKYYKLVENNSFKPLLVEKDTDVILELDKIIVTNPD
jgi:hypothetical protein